MSTGLQLLRISDVSKKTTLAKSTLWLKIAQGQFPRPIKLSPAISVWKESDVDAWIDERSKNQIRLAVRTTAGSLVTTLPKTNPNKKPDGLAIGSLTLSSRGNT